MKKSNTKPKNVSYTHIPAKLWNMLKKHLPKVRQVDGVARPATIERS